MINPPLQQAIKWEQRQRLTLLEATVFWSGELSTQVLMDGFGISRVQASKDLTLYQALCPGNIRYDKFLKRYVLDAVFKPAFMSGTAGEFLQVLRVQQDQAGGAVGVDKLALQSCCEASCEDRHQEHDRRIVRMHRFRCFVCYRCD